MVMAACDGVSGGLRWKQQSGSAGLLLLRRCISSGSGAVLVAAPAKTTTRHSVSPSSGLCGSRQTVGAQSGIVLQRWSLEENPSNDSSFSGGATGSFSGEFPPFSHVLFSSFLFATQMQSFSSFSLVTATAASLLPPA
ncbi:unnamed protein product [Cuscuta europaea]|uniref:Uncharacterized protein n=1 Tax=Cuscuta europaea TaxID=41803 RepID=A0A9P0YYH4_CUSEU|nr:unnamed protein product [Cuscuta europaea]